MNELIETKPFVPTREGPFRTCVQLPQTRPRQADELPKLYEDLHIDLKEADLANRKQRVSIRHALAVLLVLSLYVLLAVLIFPRTRFFRQPVSLVWSDSGIALVEPRTLDRLPSDIRSLLDQGHFTQARLRMDTVYFRDGIAPEVDHFLWPVYLFTLHQLQDSGLPQRTESLLDQNPHMLEPRFYQALHRLRGVHRLRLTPVWYDRSIEHRIAAINRSLSAVLADLDRVSQALIPIGRRRTPAQHEMLRLTYHHQAEVYYLMWLHDPSRPRAVTPALTESFRYLTLADPERQQAETVRLRKEMAQSFEEMMDWGFLRLNRQTLFGESLTLPELQAYLNELRQDYDRARSLP